MLRKTGLSAKLYSKYLYIFIRRKWKSLLSIASMVLSEKKKKILVRFTTEHIYGLRKINVGENEVIVVCLVRNREIFIKSFIEYYFSLGVRHIVFVDNNSTDKTVEIACSYDNVSIVRSRIKSILDSGIDIYLREYAAKRFCKNSWCLVADIDEFFDYPFSDKISLCVLIRYLKENSYTAVVTQTLDLFSDKPLNSLKSMKDGCLKELYPYYDLSNISKIDYPSSDNLISNKEIKFYFGGIRKTVFCTNNFLTKHPLVFVHKKLKMNNQHTFHNVNCADFSAVFYHYKFASNFLEIAAIYVAENNEIFYREEYSNIVQICAQNPSLTFKQKTSKRLTAINDLLQEEFLVVSDKYRQWTEKHADKK